MMGGTRDDRDDSVLIEALRAGRVEEPEQTPARLELERRRLMARLMDGRRVSAGRWRPVLVGGLAGIGAVAAAAVLLLMFVVDLPSSESDHLTLSGTWRLERGDAIARGAPIAVPDKGRAMIILADGTRIWAGPGTRLALGDPSGSNVVLESGHVVADVEPRGDGSRFTVSTAEAKVTVMGTLFSVRESEGRTAVRLHRGKVRLDSGGQSVSMQPGHLAVASSEGIRALDVIDERSSSEDLELASLASVEPVPADRDTAGMPVAAAKLPGADPLRLDAEAEEEDPATASSGEDLRIAGRKAGAGARGSAEEDEDLAVRKAVADLWKAGRYQEIVGLTKRAGLDADVLFYRAKALSKLGRWRDAGETFGAVAGMSPSSRPEALYLAARAYSRAKAFDRSLDMAQLAISVGGPNADHAWRIKLGALSGSGRYGEAARAAQEYLEQFPGGAHVREAVFVRATGLRISREWGAAAVAYSRYIGSGPGGGAMGDDAAFYLGYCKMRAGSDAEGRRHLEKYLEQYPTGRHAGQASKALGI